jgi:hypothetical protein
MEGGPLGGQGSVQAVTASGPQRTGHFAKRHQPPFFHKRELGQGAVQRARARIQHQKDYLEHKKLPIRKKIPKGSHKNHGDVPIRR